MGKVKDLMEKNKELFNKDNGDFCLFLDLLNIEQKMLKDKDLPMSIYPIDIPSIIIEDITKYYGDPFCSNFINSLILKGFKKYVENLTEKFKNEMLRYNKYSIDLKNLINEVSMEEFKKDFNSCVDSNEKNIEFDDNITKLYEEMEANKKE